MENWCQNLTIKQLIKLLEIKNITLQRGLERNEIEQIIIENILNLEEAESLLSFSLLSDEVNNKLQSILSQNRHILNFTIYETCSEHKNRISQRPIRMNIPRNDWFNHPNFRRKPQMPSYHVHFREEMQSVLNLLYAWYQNNQNEEYGIKKFQQAYNLFQNSMEGLHFHVQIEENSFFPELQSKNPDFDLSFLYKDHEYLHQAEDNLLKKFQLIKRKLELNKGKKNNNNNGDNNNNNSNSTTVTIQDKSELLALAVTYDEVLINHLGEEEEIVVPLCL